MYPALYCIYFLSAFLAAVCFAEGIAVRTSQPGRTQALANRPRSPTFEPRFVSRIVGKTGPDVPNDHELLDIVLVASVDGKFHALNRTDGRSLWSMAPSSESVSAAESVPSSLSPLIKTNHIDYDPDLMDETTNQEIYIIEPQSGDIYVTSTPAGPMHRFPFSMPELVDMSPFSFSADEGGRLFIGKKETSLLVVELETGRVKASLTAERIFDYEDGHLISDEIDLDELEEEKPARSPVREVLIGRTDYHLSIFTKDGRNPAGARVLNQKLSFSTYGPDRHHALTQASYRRTKDDAYIQSLPNGQLMAFKAKTPEEPNSNSKLLWAHTFKNPVVAIFDVFQEASAHSNSTKQPYVLLQPRPRLQDIFNKFDPKAISALPNLRGAYIGLIEETESLYAMSPEQFPLLVFDFVPSRSRLKVIDPPSSASTPWSEADNDMPRTVDEVTKDRKESEFMPGGEYCQTIAPGDRRCFVGIRQLVDSDESRIMRLLDSPDPHEPDGTQPPLGDERVEQHAQQPSRNSGNGHVGNAQPLEPSTINESLGRTPLPNIDPSSPVNFFRPSTAGKGLWEGVVFAIVLGAISLWFGLKRKGTLGSASRRKEKAAMPDAINTAAILNGHQDGVNTTNVGMDVTAVAVPIHSGQHANGRPLSIEQNAPMIPSEQALKIPNSTPLFASSTPSTPSTPISPSSSLFTSNQSPYASVDDSSPSSPPSPLQTSRISRARAISAAPPFNLAISPNTNDDDGEESANEADDTSLAPTTPGKKKIRRGRRGKKKKAGAGAAAAAVVDGGERETMEVMKLPPTPPSQRQQSSIVIQQKPKPQITSLIVSDTILGFGSHGTVVFQGSLQGRSVAVKRLLRDFVTLADREVSILQESDDHPNVIRYYYQEAQDNFLYIALELCPASLADIIEQPDRDQFRDIAVRFDPKKALRQITAGLRHLHALKLIHRDIKPQNILISTAKSSGGGEIGNGGSRMDYRMLISDFGLTKKLERDQTSFLPTAHGAMAAGTVGWRAPEILRGEVALDDVDDNSSFSSRGSTSTVVSHNGRDPSGNQKPRTRLTKSVDIFALGCLFFYVLTMGGHPFGSRFEREVNILKNEKNLEGLSRFGEEGEEAVVLIEMMLNPEARKRPDTTQCLLHPYFWDSSRRLTFLTDVSDRFEIMCREPKDEHLLELEKDAQKIVGNDWQARLDKMFIENLGKFRKYDPKSIQDLLRALRNKKNHYQDLPDNVKRHLGPMPEGFLGYFTRRYPKLFIHAHSVVESSALRTESIFRPYFELADS